MSKNSRVESGSGLDTEWPSKGNSDPQFLKEFGQKGPRVNTLKNYIKEWPWSS